MPLKIQMELLADLQRFGLNPQDWTLRPSRSTGFELQHRRDPAFQLRGRIGRLRRKSAWKELELQSL